MHLFWRKLCSKRATVACRFSDITRCSNNERSQREPKQTFKPTRTKSDSAETPADRFTEASWTGRNMLSITSARWKNRFSFRNHTHTHTERETQATSTGTKTAALLDKKDWLPPVTRNVAGQDPPARHEASGRSVKGKRPSPVTARYSGGGICTTGGHLGAWGSGHSSEGHTKPPNAFPSTLTLLHPQSKRVRSGDDDNERSIAICRPPMMEQRSSGNRSRQQLVLQARRCVTELGVEMSDHWSWFLDKPNLKANSVRKKINLHATPLN